MQFAASAEQYDRFMGRYTPTLAVALADAAGVEPGMRVLDVGCGPGGLTRELVARVGAANVAAIDPAAQFSEACRTRNPGADVRVGVAEELPWPDGEFDAVLSSLVLGFMRDPEQGVREMARVTRPGGVVAACMWDIAEGGMTMLRLFWSAVREVAPGTAGERSLAGHCEGRHRGAVRPRRPCGPGWRRALRPGRLRGLRRLLGAVHVRGRTVRPVSALAGRRAAGQGPRGMQACALRRAVLARRSRLVRARHRPHRSSYAALTSTSSNSTASRTGS